MEFLSLVFVALFELLVSSSFSGLTLFIMDTSKQVVLQMLKDPDEIPHKEAFHYGLHCLLLIRTIFRHRNILEV